MYRTLKCRISQCERPCLRMQYAVFRILKARFLRRLRPFFMHTFLSSALLAWYSGLYHCTLVFAINAAAWFLFWNIAIWRSCAMSKWKQKARKCDMRVLLWLRLSCRVQHAMARGSWRQIMQPWPRQSSKNIDINCPLRCFSLPLHKETVPRFVAGAMRRRRKVRAAQGAPLLKVEAVGDSRWRQKKTTAMLLHGKGEKAV